jgi:hypothetical protein
MAFYCYFQFAITTVHIWTFICPIYVIFSSYKVNKHLPYPVGLYAPIMNFSCEIKQNKERVILLVLNRKLESEHIHKYIASLLRALEHRLV